MALLNLYSARVSLVKWAVFVRGGMFRILGISGHPTPPVAKHVRSSKSYSIGIFAWIRYLDCSQLNCAFLT